MPSKQNSQIVMPPLVRGAQVSGAGWGALKHSPKGSESKGSLLTSGFSSSPSAHRSDSPADSQSTPAAASAQRLGAPAAPAGSQGLCAQCPGSGPEDHSAGTHPGG